MEFNIQKLLEAEQEARKNLDAIGRVKKLMGIDDVPAKSDNRQFDLIPTPPIQPKPEGDGLDEAPVTSLRGKIEQVVNADPNTKWTTQKVLAHLQATGYPLKAQKPIYSVGQSLQKLAQVGRIRLVRKGVGSAPNIYRARVADADMEVGSTEANRNLSLQ